LVFTVPPVSDLEEKQRAATALTRRRRSVQLHLPVPYGIHHTASVSSLSPG
jgi:hypothetical protein